MLRRILLDPLRELTPQPISSPASWKVGGVQDSRSLYGTLQPCSCEAACSVPCEEATAAAAAAACMRPLLSMLKLPSPQAWDTIEQLLPEKSTLLVGGAPASESAVSGLQLNSPAPADI